ncbi:AMP-binding protein [Mycobacterium pinniadriaticum]|uniref:AMP-binding protein n=1 Tax=Mycobacterium pinniadriaticum TaxID=2994102 RepID=UPI002B058CDA|nr:AMP-binding protein [Mycobacterium pinniadriaticum]
MTLDSQFDDLGIGSLEMAELLLRVQKALGLTLPAHVLGSAETPRDLLRAIEGSPDRSPEQVQMLPPLSVAGGGAEPSGATTLIEALEWHVHASPERVHIRILDERGGADELTYAALLQEATAAAHALRAREIVSGDTVAIMLPTSREYFVTFIGVLLAGAVPVPLYPPARRSRLPDHLRRHVGILANARAVMLVTVPEAVALGQLLRSNVDGLREVVTPETLTGATALPLPRCRSGDLALVQYTSGSTGQPKGVALTHDNLLANITAMGRAAAVSSTDIFVSWLPLYHDMGLIGAWLSPLYFGIPLVVMAPQVFLANPARWLNAIHTYRGTISAGPNFAYEMCLTKIDEAELGELDLSSWRLAFNGAEPVSARTVERFSERFRAVGFRPEAMTPVYGLAESSVGLAFPPLDRGPLIDRLDRDIFVRSGRAESSKPGDPDALSLVACGHPLPGHQIRIVDPVGHELGDRQEGRIEFRGPSATSGYLNNPDATHTLFDGNWLDTGDLGYFAEGDLYVTGRVKDVIIRAGRKLHPAELEEAVGNLDDARKGCVAVFASADPAGGSERLVVVAETRATDDAAKNALRAAIMATTVDLLGLAPDDVVLAPPGTVLKTSSGKIRRAACRELYEQSAIGAPPAPLWWELARIRLRGLATSALRARRRAAAAGFAAYARAVFTVLALVVIALLAVLPRIQWRWRVACGATRLLARLTRTPITVNGLDHLPDQPCLMVANHPSWLDGLALTAVLPSASFRYVAGEVLEHERLNGFVLRRLGTEFVERHERERGVADTDRLVNLARAGESLVVFPEAHLSPAPGVRPFHMGAFIVAAQAGAPVVPLGIRGTRQILRPGHGRPAHGAIDIVVGEPITPAGSDWATAVGLRDAARLQIGQLSGEPTVD